MRQELIGNLFYFNENITNLLVTENKLLSPTD